MNSISPNLNIMIKAAEKASKILIRDFGEIEKLQVSLKGPGDFVTASDKRVEKIIIGELEKSEFCQNSQNHQKHSKNYAQLGRRNGRQAQKFHKKVITSTTF